MQHLPAQTELFQHAGAEVLNQNVRLAEQFLQHFAPGLMLEVEGDRLLVTRLYKPPQRRALVQLAPLAQRITTIR